jgi:ribokinase
MKKIVVVGSLNLDLVAAVSRMPAEGETIAGSDFATFPGGKGQTRQSLQRDWALMLR